MINGKRRRAEMTVKVKSLLTVFYGSSQVSCRGELVVQRRALRGVCIWAPGGRHRDRLCRWILTGCLWSHLLPCQDVTRSVWQGRVRGPNTVRSTETRCVWTLNRSFEKFTVQHKSYWLECTRSISVPVGEACTVLILTLTNDTTSWSL